MSFVDVARPYPPARLRISVLVLVLLAASALVSSCGSGIQAGDYTSAEITVEIYEGLANQQARGLTRAIVSCDPDEILIGGGFRTDATPGMPIQIAASYPSDGADNEVAPGISPTTWTVMGYSASGGGKLAAYALCLSSPTTALVTTSVSTAMVTPATYTEITAVCPYGEALLGGGFMTEQTQVLSPPPQLITLSPLASSQNYNKWTITLLPPGSGRSEAKSIAMCIAGRSGLTIFTNYQLHVVYETAPVPGGVPVTGELSCWASHALTGGGFEAAFVNNSAEFVATTDIPLVKDKQVVWHMDGYTRPGLSGLVSVWTVCAAATVPSRHS